MACSGELVLPRESNSWLRRLLAATSNLTVSTVSCVRRRPARWQRATRIAPDRVPAKGRACQVVWRGRPAMAALVLQTVTCPHRTLEERRGEINVPAPCYRVGMDGKQRVLEKTQVENSGSRSQHGDRTEFL